MNKVAIVSLAFTAMLLCSTISVAQLNTQSGLLLGAPSPASMGQDRLDLAAYEVQGIRTELISLYDRVPSMKVPRAFAVIGGVASVIGLGMFMKQTDPFEVNESSRSPYVATAFAVGGTITILTSLLILAVYGRKHREIKKRIALLERNMKLKMSF